ncbi:MAG: iron-sulfur cluster assembly scaffold protein [Bacteroidota bacterium]
MVQPKDVCDWLYSGIVKKHFLHPKNFLVNDKKYKADGIGVVGSPDCGDMMIVWIKVDKKSQRIKECKWRTFGCASAIASSSIMSVMATEKGGMKLSQALKLKPEQIVDRLGGLPNRKFHCSVLGQDALRKAIEDYLSNEKHRKQK